MKRFWKCDQGATLVEFALVALPVILFIFGIMQTAYIVWVDNLLQTAVNTAARCGAVNSETAPCSGTDMITAAQTVFSPLDGASFATNSGCDSGSLGLVGSYSITIVFVVDLTVTTASCYPTIPVPA